MKLTKILKEEKTIFIPPGKYVLQGTEDGNSWYDIALVVISKDQNEKDALLKSIKKVGGDYNHPEFYKLSNIESKLKQIRI